MIGKASEHTFTQLIDGVEVEHNYKDVKIRNGFIHLPKFNNKIEVLNYNGGDDEHSLLVAKIFARVASLQSEK